MKKVTILTSSLGYGGVEKQIASLCNALSSSYQFEIICIYKLYERLPYEMDKNVKVKYLINDIRTLRMEEYKELLHRAKLSKLLKVAWRDYLKSFELRYLIKDIIRSKKVMKSKKKIISQELKKCDSDIIITTDYKLNKTLSKLKKKNILKIGWEHAHHHGDANYASDVIESAKNLDYLVLVSNSLKNFYEKKLSSINSKCKCVYIPNMIEEVKHKKKSNNKRIISVGKLTKEKAFLDLIDVFYLVHQTNKDWILDIIGDGKEREKIETRIRDYSLEDIIHIHGFRERDYINNILSSSQIFVSTSHTESFGIVLLEAMSFSLPTVSFDEAEGTKELIDEKCGILIKNRNKEEMALKINELINNQKLRETLGRESYKKSLKYLPKNIKKDWSKILK